MICLWCRDAMFKYLSCFIKWRLLFTYTLILNLNILHNHHMIDLMHQEEEEGIVEMVWSGTTKNFINNCINYQIILITTLIKTNFLHFLSLEGDLYLRECNNRHNLTSNSIIFSSSKEKVLALIIIKEKSFNKNYKIRR